MTETSSQGLLSIVGIGPGNHDYIVPAALKAIENADMVIGYRTYMLLVRKLIKDKERIQTGMTEEIERARHAVHEARSGKRVAIISSGDAGVYGMGTLVFEVLKQEGWKKGDSPEVEVIPGATALNSCASLVGTPLGHDSCMISLSDLLTPWPIIEKRIHAAAEGDFVIGFYNPASGRDIIAQYRPLSTPVALVKSAYRFRQNIVMTDLESMLDYEIGMLTTVLVGSSQTYMFEGYMVTPRGYQNKYNLEDGVAHQGQTPGISINHELIQ